MKREIVASSKRSFVKASTADQMLDAFESKLDELEGRDVESASDVTCGEYIDVDGMFGQEGAVITDREAQKYWDEAKDSDPVLSEYPDFKSWWADTKHWLKQIDASVDEIDKDLEPVKGEESWNEDNVFMLMGYTGGTEGPESDSFDCYGKFFARDENDANRQLEEAKQADPDRMQFVDNAYVEKYNDYFDDGDEVYPDLATLVKSAWIAPNDYEGNIYDEELPFASTQAEGDPVEAALIVNEEEVADTVEDVECEPVLDPIDAALIIDGEEVADTIEDIECATVPKDIEDKLWDIDQIIDDKFEGADDSEIPAAVALAKEMIMSELGVDEKTAERYMKDVLGYDDTYLPVESADEVDEEALENAECCGDVPVEGSIELTDEQKDIVWDIANRYSGSSPVSGRWEDETAHEQKAIAEELGVSLEDAKQIMIDFLGFDPELEGMTFEEHWADDIDSATAVEAGLFSDYFGKEQADKYGDLIAENLSGKTVSKRKDLAEEPGGLIYEAEMLGIDMWDLLEALEGMCYQGRAREIDDSTYKVIK